ncbi:unnamed protein product [Arctia plantaginis]|uniref:CCHC-type domain-containing protein n=1 Tax=Arctia plantaginis TaxID=874455 RepID=A0A8S1AWB3_ARCPL|nr:unnamed protein product [Arctia plantaginis]
MAAQLINIPQLESGNFRNWLFRIQIALHETGAREVIKRKIDDKDQELIKNYAKARNTIIQTLPDKYLEYVKSASTAHEMIENLKNIFERKSTLSNLYLKRQLLSLKCKKDSVEEHFSKFDKLIKDIEINGTKMEEQDIVEYKMGSRQHLNQDEIASMLENNDDYSPLDSDSEQEDCLVEDDVRSDNEDAMVDFTEDTSPTSRQDDPENHVASLESTNLEIALHETGAREVIKRKIDDKDQELIKNYAKARNTIIQTLPDKYLEYVKSASTAHEMIENLKNIFERKSTLSNLYLKRQLLSLKCKKDSVEEHFSKFDKLIKDIEINGTKMEEQDIVCQLLLSVEEAYQPVVTALEMSNTKLTVEFIKGKLLDAELKEKNQQKNIQEKSNPHNEYVFQSASLKCYNCGEPNHFARN